jgi:glycosyltransferase involved in cell wall biosynthesis
MTILWIPHSPSSTGAVRRDQHLIRHLQDQHKIISVTWETRNGLVDPEAFWRGLWRYAYTLPDGRTAYHVRRVPDLLRPLQQDKRRAMRLNEALFRRDVKTILRREEVDLMITADSGFMTGLPPFDVQVPIVFDYLDCAVWDASTPAEKPYLEQSDAVLAVSTLAEEQARQFSSDVTYLPNGADLARLRSASGEEVRERYGLADATVVSLVGLGASGSHYFIEAVRRARRKVSDLRCLLVGSSEAVERSLSELSPEAQEAFVYVGPVPYEKVASFFAASDVGIYPVDATTYDDGRCPIKIFEYTALGIPVVVPELREVRRLGFNNVVHADPTPSSFAEGIVEATKLGSTPDPSVETYDWSRLADRLDQKLRRLLVRESGE